MIVNKLTKNKLDTAGLNTLIGFMCLSVSATCSAEQTVHSDRYESLQTITLAAEEYALEQINDEKLSHITAKATSLNSGLQLAKCDQALEAFGSNNSTNVTRTTVGIRCPGKKTWTLYVPVHINAMAQVIVSAKPLLRGDSLLTSDLEVREIALDKLPRNYLSEVEELTHMELTRAIKAGSVITLNSVKVRPIIQNGQEVMIIAKGSGVQVRMTGIALRNGAFGELIPIRNKNSGRTIEATIVDSGTVAVNM